MVTGGYDHTGGLKDDGTAVAARDNGYGRRNVSGWDLNRTPRTIERRS
jgi:hypothetical protein